MAAEPLEPTNPTDSTTTPKKSKRGFAGMSEERQRQIASLGGRSAHELGTAHEFTAEEARAAGRRGGQAISADRAHMAEIGRRGGVNRGKRLREAPKPE